MRQAMTSLPAAAAPGEPSPRKLARPLARYFLATRPPFLLVTAGSCLIGLATAFAGGVAVDPFLAAATLLFALLAHAGANTLNDYYDSVSGNDAANVERLFPFTGGSRFIQNGVLTERRMLALGTWLCGLTILGGLALMWVSGPKLLFYGAAGLLIGWAYSATPLKLNSRGWGEACIWVAWMIVAAGADYVQRGAPSAAPFIASSGFALLVTNVLFINQFPDRRADEAVGKRHWVVRLGPERAARVYPAIAIAANACVLAAVIAGSLPFPALAALAVLPLSLGAARQLQRHRHDVARLAPAIQASIAAALGHAVLLSAGLALARVI